MSDPFPGPDEWPEMADGQLFSACYKGGAYHHEQEAALRARKFPDMYPTPEGES